MPRGRPRKQSEVLQTLADAVGPALIEAVAAQEIKEKEEVIKKPVKYCKIHFRNLDDPGAPIDFNYLGDDVHLVEGRELEVKRSVVDWVNSLTVKKSKMIREPGADFGKLVHMPRPRCYCEILEEYER